MLAEGQKLGTFLRGTRDYVQGTQLLARTAALVLDQTARLEQAAFSHITDHDALAFLVGTEPEGVEILGRCRFAGNKGPMDFVWASAPDPAPQLDADMGIDFSVSGRLESGDAEASFGRIAALEEMLNVLVQGLKTHHSALFPGAKDIWFTGLRKANFPATWPEAWPGGTIGFADFRAQERDGRIQTMCRADLTSQAGETLSAYVTFAAKRETD
ncbi:MAG: hypothetical protein H6873_01000 [Hyphomicrobiaceae bacterium]|nr:hypothetical protein [Hyphomicrobiaceae bacterium]